MKTLGTILLTFALIALIVLLPAFVVMLILGGLHSAYPQVPALGFLACFGILWLLSIAGHSLRGN